MTIPTPWRPRTPRRRHRLIILFAICVVLSACAAPEPMPPEHIQRGDFTYADDYLDWIIRRNMARADIPGCAVGVVSRERVLFMKTYGTIRRGSALPVTQKTFFRAGSITKSLTALAVVKLKEEGLLDLDTPLSRYIPEFSVKSRFPDARPITVRDLLTHRSGLTGDYLSGIMGAHRLTQAELISALREEYLCFPPGEVFYYSNTGYSLLGGLIERVSGRRYEEYVKSEILNPVGMTASALELTPSIEPLLASGHMPQTLGFFPGGEKGTAPVPFLPLRDAAAGALITNIEELSRYAQFLLSADGDGGLDPPIVSSDGLSAMMRPYGGNRNAAVFEALDYGLGFMLDAFLYEDLCGPDDLVHHSGNVNGFYSLLVLSRSYGLGLVFLCNSASGFFSCYDIVSRGFRKYLDAARVKPQGTTVTSGGMTPPRPAPDDPSSAPLDALTGRYALLGVPVDVTRRGNELRLVFPPARFDLRLTRTAGNRFTAEALVLGFIPIDPAPFLGLSQTAVVFDPSTAGAPTLFLEGTAGEAVIRLALRKAGKTAVPPSFGRFLGDYELISDERNAEALRLYLPLHKMTLAEKDGWLTLSSSDLGVEIGLAMTPIADDRALLLGTNETVFFSEDEIRFSGLKAKRVRPMREKAP